MILNSTLTRLIIMWRYALTCCAVSSLIAAGPMHGSMASRPDVFLITIDTLRADHVHLFGSPQVRTPALDALAASGIRFAQTFTVSPITNSSHASILTGLLPNIHGVTDFAMPLSSSHSTSAELVKKYELP